MIAHTLGGNRGERGIDAIGRDRDDGGVNRRTEPTRDVVFVVYDGIQALDLTGPWEVFHGANDVLDETGSHRPRYRLTLCSTDGRSIRTETGLQIATEPLGERAVAAHARRPRRVRVAIRDRRPRADRRHPPPGCATPSVW